MKQIAKLGNVMILDAVRFNIQNRSLKYITYWIPEGTLAAVEPVTVLHTEAHDENLFWQHLIRTRILVSDAGNSAGVH